MSSNEYKQCFVDLFDKRKLGQAVEFNICSNNPLDVADYDQLSRVTEPAPLEPRC